MKILAIANAHALAHVSRLLEVAKVLRERGHSITFAGTGKYLPVAARDGFPTRDLPYISVERVVEAVRSQRLWTLYRKDELAGFIEAELALYAELSPELLLLDNRPTARTSAEVARIHTAAVLNVHMSNHRDIPFFSYRQLAPRLPGMRAADRIENAIERRLYDRVVMAGLNALRRERGLPRRFAYEHEEGDIALLADVPDFNPVTSLPSHACYVGPLTWHNGLPAPSCVSRLDPHKPTAYFSLGSEGLDELVGRLGDLAREGLQIVVATGVESSAEGEVSDGIFLERYVNPDELLPHCSIVCCHGGNGTLYQALGHRLPCVVVATHAEQHYGGKRIQQLGLGASLTLRQVRASGIGLLVDAVRQVMASDDCRARARSLANAFDRWQRPAERAADAIERRFR